MNRSFLQRTAFIICIITSVSAARAVSDSPYSRYSDLEYGYSILIPRTWRKASMNLHYRRLIIMSRGPGAEIRIAATRPDLKDIEKWNMWRSWYTDRKGRNLRSITETRDLLIEKNIVGRVLLFEYTRGSTRILQKVLIAKYDDKLLTVECSAPVSSYHRYNKTFTTVMGSIHRLKRE